MLKLLPLEFLSVIFKIFDALSAKSFRGGGEGCAPVWGLYFAKKNKSMEVNFY